MITVDKGFMRELKRMDRRLGCFFNRSSMKFVITYERATRQPVPVATVAGMENGVFRQPGTRDLVFIKSGDLANTRVKDKFLQISKHMEDVREKQRRDATSEWRDRTKDSKTQLAQAFNKASGHGKGNSAFRRI